MIKNGKSVCDRCGSCFTCGTPKKILLLGAVKRELCPKCYEVESKK